MVIETDIWTAANMMIEMHGADAEIHAAMRADALLERGDMDGVNAWKRIIKAIEVLRIEKPQANAILN
jgi:hypothetical protein